MERKPYNGSGPRSRSSAASGRTGSASRSSAPQARNGYSYPPNRPQNSGYRPQEHPYAEDYGKNAYNDRRRPPQRPVKHNNVRRQAGRKRSRKRFLRTLIPLVLLFCFLAVGIHFARIWYTVDQNSNTYCANISVNGINLDSYTKEEGVQAVQNELNARINTPYTLTCQGQSWTFTPADFNASIDTESFLERAWNIGHVGNLLDRQKAIADAEENVVEFSSPMVYDENLIDSFLAPIATAVYREPVNATVVVDVDKPYLSGQSQLGQELDMEAAHDMIVSLIENGQRESELPLLPIEPAISSDAATGGMTMIVQYSTDTTFRRTAPRKNIAKALKYFNAYTVHPGDIVNFNDVVGKRSEERGWFLAAEYVGNTSQDSYGGGVCQASSTLYGAVLLAGMDIIERSNHSMTVSYCEPSLDAAVTDTNYKNFIFQNNTDHTIYIYTDVNKETATVTIYGNRPKYRYELVSEIVRQDSKCLYESYIPDEDGTHAYYTTQTAIHTEGHPALESRGWLVAYDWDTGEEVSRKRLSYDIYESGTNIYWRGIHDPVTGAVVDYENW